MKRAWRILTLPLLAAAMVIMVPLAATGESPGDVRRKTRSSGSSASPCAENDIPCRMNLAADARRMDRFHEAETIYRTILRDQPQMDDAYEALLELTADRSLSKHSQAYRTARDLLDDSFQEYETRRFIVLSDAEPQWSHSQVEYLERSHHQFMRFAKRLQLRPLPLKHKLVCVLFSQQRDYRAFADAHDAIDDPWIVGHYSPSHDRVVFFQHSEDQQREPSPELTIATTIHEAIHQLHFHTRIKSLNVQYPLWICEGLATAFETDRPNEAFGPDHEYLPRRSRFEQLLQKDQLLPLRELVTITQLRDVSQTQVAAVYHQSYALVAWLNRYRSSQLRDYLNAMLREPPGKVSQERHLAIFQQAFGNIQRLEHVWLAHERTAIALNPPSEPADDQLMQFCRCHQPPAPADDRVSYRLLAYARAAER